MLMYQQLHSNSLFIESLMLNEEKSISINNKGIFIYLLKSYNYSYWLETSPFAYVYPYSKYMK
jgi:hypothetical protein